MRVVIDVLKADIEKGVQGDGNTCAVSRGIERHVRNNYKKFGLDSRNEGVEVATAEDSVSVCYGDSFVPAYKAKATKTLKRFINLFDENKKLVKPCRLALDFKPCK